MVHQPIQFSNGIDGYIGAESAFIGLSVYILFGEKLGLILAAAVAGFLNLELA